MFWTTRSFLPRWNPFVELDRAWMSAEENGGTAETALMPVPISLWRSDDALKLVANLPGLATEDVQLSVEGDVLTLAVSMAEEGPAAAHSVRRERARGHSTRTLRLPFVIDPDRVSAKLENGRLTVDLVRAEADKPRRVAIQSA